VINNSFQQVKQKWFIDNKTQTKYKQKKLKKQFGRRAAIEPVIGHLKLDHRMKRNFYKGITGDSINVILSAAAYNFKRMIGKWGSSFYTFFIAILFYRLFLFSAKLHTQKKKYEFIRDDYACLD